MSICFGENIDGKVAEIERSDGNQASDLKNCDAVGKDTSPSYTLYHDFVNHSSRKLIYACRFLKLKN